MTAVASYLIALRADRKLTQEDAAATTGINVKTVQRWERGENEPKMSELGAYVEALGGSAHRALDLLLGRQPPLGTPDEPPGVLAARLRLASLPPDAIEILAPIADRLRRGEPPP